MVFRGPVKSYLPLCSQDRESERVKLVEDQPLDSLGMKKCLLLPTHTGMGVLLRKVLKPVFETVLISSAAV